MGILQDIPALVNDALEGILLDLTLTRETTGTYDPENDSYDSTSSTDYACVGIVEEYSDYIRANGLVEVNDRKILLLAESLSIEPTAGDVITDPGGTSYEVIGQPERDPATATYVLQGRI